MPLVTNLIITAFCSCKLCTGSHSSANVTANGQHPKQGVTVAASRSIPFGTVIRLEGMTNNFVVQDRLAKRYDSRIDVYFTNHYDALVFGKRTTKVTIYDQSRTNK